MNRLWVSFLLAASGGLLFSACDDGSGWGYAGGGGYAGSCSLQLSCGTCTPVNGCGWCTAPNGMGVCASDPDYCPTQEFTWTWDPSGCRVAADASVIPGDGETPDSSTGDGAVGDAPRGDASPSEASPDAPSGDAKGN
jgi:hypothetical protein